MIITEYLCTERPTDADLSAFEILIHGTLPHDYKAFLKKENGGRPAPKQFRFAARDGHMEDSTVHYFFALYERRVGSLKKGFERYKERIPSGYLPIGIDPFGNLILLGIAGQNPGTVYFWDHEKENEIPNMKNIFPIANSFSDFVGKLT
jgi:SMI1-KNR4 cell-wall